MDKKDYKEIILQIIGWGFPSVFVILGIVLTAIHTKLDISVTSGIVIIALGVITFLVTYILDNYNKKTIQDNKELTTQLNNLKSQMNITNQKLDELKDENNGLKLQITKLETTLELLKKEGK